MVGADSSGDGNGAVIWVVQGAQPSFEGVLVGIVHIGQRHGTPSAQLLVRSGQGVRTPVATPGEEIDLFGHGLLHVVAIELPGSTARNGRVAVRFSPVDSGAA